MKLVHLVYGAYKSISCNNPSPFFSKYVQILTLFDRLYGIGVLRLLVILFS